QEESSRLPDLISKLGWRVLAICSQSQAFRAMCRDPDQKLWEKVFAKLHEYSFNVEVLARNTGMDWRGLLSAHADLEIPGLNDGLAPLDDLSQGKTHDIVVDPATRTTREPVFNNRRQVIIDDYIFKTGDWHVGQPNPALRAGNDYGECDLCGSAEDCDCAVHRFPGEMIQLVDTGTMGVGVRTLIGFKKGDILGEFLGRLFPPHYAGDPVYALKMLSKTGVPPGTVAMISPRRLGNWTRFINHSCEPSMEFGMRTIGKRATMTLEPIRNIHAFEELTIDYGADYWQDLECQCGTPRC
ncbi:SET domain-containing protein, partial [Aspergillus ellipticus CBS 707.79]